MKIYLKSNGSSPLKLDSTKILGSGAEGVVYDLNDKGAIKIYHPQERSQQRAFKLQYLIENKPKLEYQDSIIFPKEIAYDTQGKFTGFLMDKVENTIDLTLLCNLRPSEKLDSSWKTKFNRNTRQGILNRLRLCHNIAVALHKVYETRKYVIVDIKPENIRVQLNGKIFIIDMDSVEVISENRLLFYAEKLTPEYSPAEIKSLDSKKDVIPLSWDYFSMAVVFYKILLGLHPFVGTCHEPYEEFTSIPQKISRGLSPIGKNQNYFKVIPEPHQNFCALPQNIQNLFIECFDNGFREPEKRPNTKEWIEEIRKIKREEIQYFRQRIEEKTGNSPKVVRKKKKNKGQNSILRDDLLVLGVAGILIFLFFLLQIRTSGNYSSQPNSQENIEKREAKSLYEKYKRDYHFLTDDTFNHKYLLVFNDYNSQYGIVDIEAEEVVIPCKYSELGLFHNGLAKFREKNLYGFLNKNNQVVIPAIYDSVFNFHKDRTIIQRERDFYEVEESDKRNRVHIGEPTYYLISKEGQFIQNCNYLNKYEEISEVSPGFLRVKKGNKYGIIKYDFEEVLPLIYDDIQRFRGRTQIYVAVSNGGLWGIMNLRGIEVISLRYSSLEEMTEFLEKNLVYKPLP